MNTGQEFGTFLSHGQLRLGNESRIAATYYLIEVSGRRKIDSINHFQNSQAVFAWIEFHASKQFHTAYLQSSIFTNHTTDCHSSAWNVSARKVLTNLILSPTLTGLSSASSPGSRQKINLPFFGLLNKFKMRKCWMVGVGRFPCSSTTASGLAVIEYDPSLRPQNRIIPEMENVNNARGLKGVRSRLRCPFLALSSLYRSVSTCLMPWRSVHMTLSRHSGDHVDSTNSLQQLRQISHIITSLIFAGFLETE